MREAVEAKRDRILRFGTFEVEVASAELRRRGLRVHLQEMPFQVLRMLLERPGALVRRDEFFSRLWPDDASGILDDNLNTAIAKLRVALGDPPRNPRFIETVPKRGYRFIAPVTADGAHGARPASAPESIVAPERESPAHARDGASPRRFATLFVGRDRELDELRAALRDCCAGRRYVAIVSGEAGIGKTRIAERLADEAGALGARVMWGRSLEEGVGQPYWPWVQVLRALVQSSADDVLREEMGACAADIAAVVPVLCARLGVTPSETLRNAEQERFRLFDSITEYLRRTARRQPVVLVFENLQWAGEPSLLLLEFVAQSLVDSPLFLLGTYRGSEVTRRHALFNTLGALNRESRFMRVQLRGLTLEAVAALLEQASGAPWPASVIEALHRQTEGNPFFVSEVGQLLLDERAVVPGADAAATGAGRALVIPIPEGVREVVCKRLNRLSAACNKLLSHAAVVGREFELGLLRRLLEPMDEDALMEALEEALASGAIEPELAPDRYRFTHALIKETLYDEISPAQRARQHARVGDALERLHNADREPDLPRLAHHYAKAACNGRAARAVEYGIRAAEKAESVLAYEEAVTFYQMALDALAREDQPDEGRRCHLLLATARSMSKAGHVAETIDLVDRGAACARRLGDTGALVDACRVIDYIVSNLGLAGNQAAALIEETLAAIDAQDSATRAALLGALTRACYAAGDPSRGEAALRESIAMARRVGDPKALVSALRAKLYVRDPADDIDLRLATAAEMLEVARELGDGEAQREANDLCFYDLMEKGDVETADQYLRRSGELGQAIRQPFHAHNHLIYRTMRALLEGRYDEGESLAQQALALGQRIRCQSAEGIFGLQMFTIRRDQGRLRELAGALTAFTRERSANAAWRPGLALMYCEVGRAEEARPELEFLARDEFAAIPRDSLWFTCLAYLVEVADVLQDRDRASQLYALLEPYGDRVIIVGSCVSTLGACSHYLGVLAHCLGRPGQARMHFEHALALNGRIGAKPWLARTQLRFGELLLERGSSTERREGHALIAAAASGARDLGMAALAQRAGAKQAAVN